MDRWVHRWRRGSAPHPRCANRPHPHFSFRPLRIGSFSACSNVTGALSDINAITSVLHRHGALAFWDYATAAPYVEVDLNPVAEGPDRAWVYKDGVFLSPHKFVGGPVLVAGGGGQGV